MHYMNDEQIKLYVVAHKDFDGLPEGRTVIGVGENRVLSVADVYDDCGDNIAQKKRQFLRVNRALLDLEKFRCRHCGA